jgi:hypothetical protein
MRWVTGSSTKQIKGKASASEEQFYFSELDGITGIIQQRRQKAHASKASNRGVEVGISLRGVHLIAQS